jgi:hypothetical protein
LAISIPLFYFLWMDDHVRVDLMDPIHQGLDLFPAGVHVLMKALQ